MVGQEMQVSIEDGIGGGDLEAKVVGQEMQVSAEDVAELAIPKSAKKKLQIGGDIRKTYVVNVDKIETNLEKTILMIKRQEDVVLPLMLEEENINKDVEIHA